MAERPIFVPSPDSAELVKEISLQIFWNAGFAPIQKKKNIVALHEAAAEQGYSPVLEVSTKSEKKVGQHLSAFHLKVHSEALGEIPLECAFQGSKVFARGGPYTDLYEMDVREARRDPRLHDSGALIAFNFNGLSFPIEPRTVFYDWLYINAIFPHRVWLARLCEYAAFSDIEFNPGRSINCQARSCALFIALMKRDLLQNAVSSPESFLEVMSRHSYRPTHSTEPVRGPLFLKRKGAS